VARSVKPAKAAEQKPAEQLEPGRPQEHNGLQVVREELRSNLPSGAPFKISKLHLVDGTRAFACRDCKFTGDALVSVQHHRNEKHGAKFGKKTPKVQWEQDPDLGDLVLPPRGDLPAPTNPMEMTLGEYLALAPSFAALADLVDRTERERDDLLDRLNKVQEQTKEAQHALAVYPALQAEVVELRVMVRNAGTYAELKSEVLALRAWKKKVTQRLEPLGFVLADEESKEH
jgi:hypothetical protein